MKILSLYAKALIALSLTSALLIGLMPIAEALPLRDFPGPTDPPDPPDPQDPPVSKPRSADLAAYQSPVKNQGGRDTCGSFATAAALEAAYKRNFNLDLDLSEQYLNHWAQIMLLLGNDLPQSETNSAAIGGGGMGRPFAALQRGFGVPTEAVLPYIIERSYQEYDVGDIPAINDFNIKHLQWDIDDFNLADSLTEYIFQPPNVVTTTIMPLAALQQAKYRPTGLRYATDQELRDIEWYRNQLDSKREVIFQLLDHVMLMVGYDDATQQFLVKNSYGPDWGNNGYGEYNYSIVTMGKIEQAGVIDGVVSPQDQFDVWKNKQLFLGRWNLDIEGEQNVLDIYNIPVNEQGQNHRLGTLFMSDGTMQRVNGRLSGNRLEFWFDALNPNLSITDTAPLSDTTSFFTIYLFSWDHQSMAGYLNVNGQTLGVQAVKGSSPLAGSANSGSLGLASYLGTWKFNYDGWRGNLVIDSVDLGAITGTYIDGNGSVYGVKGKINKDLHSFNFVINFPSPQKFTGFINTNQLGVISGTTVWNNITFGFYATRDGDTAYEYPPLEPEPIDPVCAKKPYLPNCQDG